jgi:hypothetical protein
MALRLSSISISRRWLLSLGALVLGALLAVVTIEIGLRAIGYGSISMLAYGRNHYSHDLPEIGYAGRPNVEGIQSREGISEVRFNSHGFHDVDHVRTPTLGTFRLVVIGNSYTMADQVVRADGYVSRLESELTRCPALASRKIETVNLGVDGYTIHQQYLVLRDYGLSLSPDFVLLQVNSFVVAGDLDPLLNLSPRLFLRSDDELEADRTYLSHPEFLRRASAAAALVQRLSDGSRLLQYLLEVRRRNGQLSTASDKPADSQALERYRSDRDMVVEKLADLLRASKIPWALTIVPTADSTSYSPEQSAPMKIDWLSLSQRLGVPSIDVEEEARTEVRTTGRFIHGFGTSMTTGHLNRHGHAFFAKALSTRLCEILGSRGKLE